MKDRIRQAIREAVQASMRLPVLEQVKWPSRPVTVTVEFKQEGDKPVPVSARIEGSGMPTRMIDVLYQDGKWVEKGTKTPLPDDLLPSVQDAVVHQETMLRAQTSPGSLFMPPGKPRPGEGVQEKCDPAALARRYGVPTARMKEYWEEAKRGAEAKFGKKSKDFEDREWAYVMGTVKKRVESFSLPTAKALIDSVIAGQDAVSVVGDFVAQADGVGVRDMERLATG